MAQELKAIRGGDIHDLVEFGDGSEIYHDETLYYLKNVADEALDEKDSDIRRLERALWLARATIAHSTKYKYHRLSCKAEIDPQPHGWSCYINGEVYRTGKMNRKLEPYYWIELWEEVERKCRAKAEEFGG